MYNVFLDHKFSCFRHKITRNHYIHHTSREQTESLIHTVSEWPVTTCCHAANDDSASRHLESTCYNSRPHSFHSSVLCSFHHLYTALWHVEPINSHSPAVLQVTLKPITAVLLWLCSPLPRDYRDVFGIYIIPVPTDITTVAAVLPR